VFEQREHFPKKSFEVKNNEKIYSVNNNFRRNFRICGMYAGNQTGKQHSGGNTYCVTRCIACGVSGHNPDRFTRR
jgi:hypothetical protein